MLSLTLGLRWLYTATIFLERPGFKRGLVLLGQIVEILQIAIAHLSFKALILDFSVGVRRDEALLTWDIRAYLSSSVWVNYVPFVHKNPAGSNAFITKAMLKRHRTVLALTLRVRRVPRNTLVQSIFVHSSSPEALRPTKGSQHYSLNM